MIFYLALPFENKRKTSLCSFWRTYLLMMTMVVLTHDVLRELSQAEKKLKRKSHKATSKWQATEPFDFFFCKRNARPNITDWRFVS